MVKNKFPKSHNFVTSYLVKTLKPSHKELLLAGIFFLSPQVLAGGDLYSRVSNGDINLIPQMAECSAIFKVISEKTTGVNKEVNLKSYKRINTAIPIKFGAPENFYSLRHTNAKSYREQIKTDLITPQNWQSSMPSSLSKIFMNCGDLDRVSKRIINELK